MQRGLILDDLFLCENSTPLGAGINNAVSAEDGTGTEDCIAAHLRAITDDGSKFSKTGVNPFSIGRRQLNVPSVQSDIGTNDTGSEMSFVAKNGIPHIIEVGNFTVIEKQAVFEFR